MGSDMLATLAVIAAMFLVFSLAAGTIWWWHQNAPLRRFRLISSREEVEDDDAEVEDPQLSDAATDTPDKPMSSPSSNEGKSLLATSVVVETSDPSVSRPLVGPGFTSSTPGGNSPAVNSAQRKPRLVGPQPETRIGGWPVLSEAQAKQIVAGTEESSEADQSDTDSVPTEDDEGQPAPEVETSEIVSAPRLVPLSVADSPGSVVQSSGPPSRRHPIVKSGDTKMFVSSKPSPAVPGSIRRRTGGALTLLGVGGFNAPRSVRMEIKPITRPEIAVSETVGSARPPTEKRLPRRHHQARTEIDAGLPASMPYPNEDSDDSGGGSSGSDRS